MIQNLIWATGYNFIAISLTDSVLYASGFVLGMVEDEKHKRLFLILFSLYFKMSRF
ncbi:hypothetical protein [Yeosuana marina]|uniref:hypothetical protein n=1 Tax=Yeosuana marina TaxID=1565536 RepID=UPI0030C8175E